MPAGIRVDQITAGHAKEFHEKLKAKGMATTTIHKRIQLARQFMHDAVDWKIIDEAFEIFGHKSEFMVAAPQYRAAANTEMGWKNANLRSEMLRLLRRAGIPSWPRLRRSALVSRLQPAGFRPCRNKIA